MKEKTKPINFRASEERIGLIDEAVAFLFPDGTRADLINRGIDNMIEPIIRDLERIRKMRDHIPPTRKTCTKKPRINGTPQKSRNKRRKAHA